MAFFRSGSHRPIWLSIMLHKSRRPVMYHQSHRGKPRLERMLHYKEELMLKVFILSAKSKRTRSAYVENQIPKTAQYSLLKKLLTRLVCSDVGSKQCAAGLSTWDVSDELWLKP